MEYNTNNHINISHVDTDAICRITACLADTIVKSLFDFVDSRGLYGYTTSYTAALEIVGEWAKEFYAKYYLKLKDWDSFEESDENIYNAMSWDNFATDWVNDRFKKYKLDIESDLIHMKCFGNASIPKIVIVHRNNGVPAVYSNLPVIYAVIDFDKSDEYWITTSESDSVAEDLCTLFDSDEPVDASIIKQLKHLDF